MYSQGNTDLSILNHQTYPQTSFKNIADQRALEILQNVMESKSKSNSIVNKEELVAEEDLVICSMTGRSLFLYNQYFKSSIKFKTVFTQDGYFMFETLINSFKTNNKCFGCSKDLILKDNLKTCSVCYKLFHFLCLREEKILRKNGFVKIVNIFRRVISLFTTNLIFFQFL